MSQSRILVTGATGTVGSEVVKELVEKGVPVRVLTRDPEKAKKFGGSVEVVVGDLAKPETLAPAFAGVDKAFVLSSFPVIADGEINAYVAAKAAGVRHIVKLSGRHIGSDFMMGAALRQLHADSEQRLQTIGVPWTILRPGSFASNFLMWLDRSQSGVFLPVGEGKDSFIDPRDIAAVAVKLLTTPGHDGLIYEIAGSELLSFSQLTQKISAATGESVTFTSIPEDAARQGMLAMGLPADLVESMLAYFAGIRTGKIYPPTSTVEQVLGRPQLSFDDWARDHAALLAAGL